MAKGVNKMDKEQLQMMADEMTSGSMFGDDYEALKEQKQQRESAERGLDRKIGKLLAGLDFEELVERNAQHLQHAFTCPR